MNGLEKEELHVPLSRYAVWMPWHCVQYAFFWPQSSLLLHVQDWAAQRLHNRRTSRLPLLISRTPPYTTVSHTAQLHALKLTVCISWNNIEYNRNKSQEKTLQRKNRKTKPRKKKQRCSQRSTKNEKPKQPVQAVCSLFQIPNYLCATRENNSEIFRIDGKF